MRVDAGANGILGIVCLVGLTLYVLGVIDWGARGVALFTLLGFVWVLVILTAMSAEQRRQPRHHGRSSEEQASDYDRVR